MDRILWTGDQYQPWMENQGHAGQAWITLSAVGQRTSVNDFYRSSVLPRWKQLCGY